VRITHSDKARLRLLFLAKHAFATGELDRIDGNHAVYHHELRTTLEQIGLNITPANSYDALFARPEADFVITLLNRGGFQNSEMLAPLLLARHGLPFLGASPIIRGAADDKHLSKLIARGSGVPTMDWQICRRGGILSPPSFRAERLVVKPNASSASWGVRTVDSWEAARAHMFDLFGMGHDVIVEQWAPLLDVAVPVIGGSGSAPWILPPMMYVPADPQRQRSYEEKRGLIEAGDDPLVPVEDSRLCERLEQLTGALLTELWPFDYGRFEFRYDPATDALLFMEVNLSCNLWSRKTISRSAATLGIDHASLVETIVAHSLARQGVIRDEAAEIAA
jgi:D-alanine-D-alanine ligase